MVLVLFKDSCSFRLFKFMNPSVSDLPKQILQSMLDSSRMYPHYTLFFRPFVGKMTQTCNLMVAAMSTFQQC